MKWDRRFDSSSSSNCACSARGEMCLALSELPVCIQKYGLDEQQISIPYEFHEGASIALVVSDIRNVTDSLARHELQDVSLELP